MNTSKYVAYLESMFCRAAIICVEGNDATGKECQTKMLKAHLESDGFRVKLVEVPIKSPLTHRLIYWMLFNGLAKKLPTLFQIIQFANKLAFQLTRLVWYRFFYSYIILDRWALSALVYGNASGVSSALNLLMHDTLVRPDVTLVLSGKSYPRPGKEDSYEADSAFQEAVKRGYKEAVKLVTGAVLVSNEGSKQEVHDRIYSLLSGSGVL